MAGNPLQMLMQLMSMGNPQQMMQNMMTQNPQIQAVLNQQKQSGLSMEQFTRQLAKQRGIDIEPMLQQMRQRGYKM